MEALTFNAFDLAMAAVVLPPLIAVVNQLRFTAQLKGIVALAVCALYALIVTWLRGPIDFHDWRNTLLVVAGVAFGFYKVWWQPSGIAPAIEAATSAAPAGPRPVPPAGDTAR